MPKSHSNVHVRDLGVTKFLLSVFCYFCSEFTKAFQHAADRIQARASFDHFNGSVIQLQKDDRGKFFDALTALSAV